MSNGKILFGITGSISGFKSAALISKLIQDGFDVQVVCTTSALKFIGEATFEGLTGKPVVKDIFEPGAMMDHIHLIRWADLFLVCPASANSINKFAAGIGDDIVSALFLAHDFKKPLLVAPAMNTAMYQHPATQKSLETLRQWGVTVLQVDSGSLACGEVGEGRLLDPERIQIEILKVIGDGRHSQLTTNRQSPPETLAPLKILITSGGTREPIDGVRFISNRSTGSTGAAIADYYSSKGHNVFYLHSIDSKLPQNPVNQISYQSFKDLDLSLKNLLSINDFDAVIHLAAVSDYSVESIEQSGISLPPNSNSKISSNGDLVLKLKKNHKILSHIKSYARNKKFHLIGFKLSTESQAEKSIQELFESSGVDFVVQNALNETGWESELRKLRLFDKNAKIAEFSDPAALAAKLEAIFDIPKEVSS